MRILWASNGPNVPSGYGVPTKNLMPFIIEAGHDLAIQAFYGIQGGSVNYGDVMIYPNQGSPYGADVIGHHAKHFNADLVVTLYDNWIFPIDYNDRFDAKWLAWFPVDGTPPPEASVLMARKADYSAVFSRNGVEEMAAVGMDVEYLPYAIDCNVFKPGSKKDAREKLGFDQDAFLISTVAANRGFPSRKSLPEILVGFKKFCQQGDVSEAHLYLHTRAVPISKKGIHLDPLIESLGLGGQISMTDPEQFSMGVPNEDLAVLYQASDVMLLPSMGEGFGLPIAEAQACGCPVITQAFSSMTELTINGLPLEPVQLFWADALNYWWAVPSVDNIAIGLNYIYESDCDWRRQQAQRGIAHFQENYAYPVVWERYWLPLLERIEAELW